MLDHRHLICTPVQATIMHIPTPENRCSSVLTRAVQPAARDYPSHRQQWRCQRPSHLTVWRRCVSFGNMLQFQTDNNRSPAMPLPHSLAAFQVHPLHLVVLVAKHYSLAVQPDC